ncbi:MAG: hypothetical protein RIM84_23760 [Alphaproteobacteria bacterium]
MSIFDHANSKYLYLRTKFSVYQSIDLFHDLADDMPDEARVFFLRVAGMPMPWENGTVIKICAPQALNDLVGALRPTLSEFDAWAMVDGRGEWSESLGEGPLSLYWSAASLESGRAGMAQMALVFRFNDRDKDGTADRVRQALRPLTARPVFWTDPGRVLFIHTDQPASTLARRIERHLPALYSWFVCDANGNTLSGFVGRDIDPWRMVDMRSVGYVPDDEFEVWPDDELDDDSQESA